MRDTSRPSTVTSRARRPWLAAILSFVFPGLGQAYAGQRRLAAVLALPVVLLVLAGAAIVVGLADSFRNSLFSSGFLIGLLLVNVALLAWRAFAISHAGLTVERPLHGPQRRLAIGVVALLLALSVGMHAYVGVVVAHLEGTLSQVFGEGSKNPEVAQPPGADPKPPDEPADPEYRWDGDERINILLLGTDAAPGRVTVLPDVIMVVSVDPVDASAVMISVPRDTGFVPLRDQTLYPDGVYPDKVNGLMVKAANDPDTWCPDLAGDGSTCGLRILQQSIGLYLGIETHHYALVDMAGFAQLIDALGGLDLCLPGDLVDPEFDGSLRNTGADGQLILPAGCHHYNGLDALAYARSRQGWIEMPDGTREQQTDFLRNERQQRVLLALRNELARADTIFELPGVLGAIGRTVRTDFPRDQAGDLASLLPLITAPDIERIVLAHPEYVDLPAQPEVNYLLVPKREAIRDEMARIFGADALTGWYLGDTDPAPESEAENETETP